MIKICATCGAVVENGGIQCPECGGGIFEATKVHRENPQLILEPVSKDIEPFRNKLLEVSRTLGLQPPDDQSSSKDPFDMAVDFLRTLINLHADGVYNGKWERLNLDP